MISRNKTFDREGLKVVTLEGKLAQWPFLQSVLVFDVFDRKVLEALFLVNGMRKFFKQLVNHF